MRGVAIVAALIAAPSIARAGLSGEPFDVRGVVETTARF
jgi:hypothetical protein